MTRQGQGATKENMSETTTGTPYGARRQAKLLYLQRVPRMPDASPRRLGTLEALAERPSHDR